MLTSTSIQISLNKTITMIMSDSTLQGIHSNENWNLHHVNTWIKDICSTETAEITTLFAIFVLSTQKP